MKVTKAIKIPAVLFRPKNVRASTASIKSSFLGRAQPQIGVRTQICPAAALPQ